MLALRLRLRTIIQTFPTLSATYTAACALAPPAERPPGHARRLTPPGRCIARRCPARAPGAHDCHIIEPTRIERRHHPDTARQLHLGRITQHGPIGAEDKRQFPRR